MQANPVQIDPAQSVEDVPRHVVLIVDDSRLQRKIISSSVRKWGFDVVEAASGQEALEICEDVQPDFVLSDWMMPGMNGLELCQAFREQSGERYGYFILLTSKSDKNEVARGLDAGADDFLSKPVNAHELRARISAGERILRMQRELSDKNRVISETLDELQRLYDSLDSDLIEAKHLQQSLVPEREKRYEQADLALMLRQCGHVGGDLVGFFPAADGHLGLFSIDVSGHGISSALMTARVAGYLSASAPSQNIALMPRGDGTYSMRSPAEAIGLLNDLVLDEMDTEHYFTMILADVDLQTGKITMAQAGHPHPVIQRADGRVEQVGEGGFPVGLMSGIPYSEFDAHLNAGDRLLLLSDGVVECPAPGGDMLEEEGLAAFVTDMADVRGTAFLEMLIWKLTEFAGERQFPDDVSGLLFEYKGQNPRA